MNKELNQYSDFVKAVTSSPSLDINVLVTRLLELSQNKDINISQLLTGSVGISSEGGELGEVVKKILFQSKPLDDAAIFHMKRELGDIIFYWINACMALNIDPYEVIDENIRKLETRYPGGKFSMYHSENREEGDL